MARELHHFLRGFLKKAKQQFNFLESYPGQVQALQHDIQMTRPNFDWMGPLSAENWAPKNHVVGADALNGMLSQMLPENFIWPGTEFIRRNGIYDALRVKQQSKQFPLALNWGNRSSMALPKLNLLSNAY